MHHQPGARFHCRAKKKRNKIIKSKHHPGHGHTAPRCRQSPAGQPRSAPPRAPGGTPVDIEIIWGIFGGGGMPPRRLPNPFGNNPPFRGDVAKGVFSESLSQIPHGLSTAKRLQTLSPPHPSLFGGAPPPKKKLTSISCPRTASLCAGSKGEWCSTVGLHPIATRGPTRHRAHVDHVSPWGAQHPHPISRGLISLWGGSRL